MIDLSDEEIYSLVKNKTKNEINEINETKNENKIIEHNTKKKQEDDKLRYEQLKMQDEIARDRFNQLNQRLIINK